MTGFVDLEASMAGKWLELAHADRAGRKAGCCPVNPDTAPGGGSYYVPTLRPRLNLLK